MEAIAILSDPLRALPTAAQVRTKLEQLKREATVLRRLLTVAERVERFRDEDANAAKTLRLSS